MKKPTILICDDEPGVRESLKLILDREYTLLYATNGEEALEHIRKNNPDLAITDIKMPKMGGLELLRRLRRFRSRLKVIVATGYDSGDVAGQAIKLGATDYLVKPFEREEVLTKIRSLLHP